MTSQQQEHGNIFVLTYQSLRTLLESIRSGDSIEEAMLAAEELAINQPEDK